MAQLHDGKADGVAPPGQVKDRVGIGGKQPPADLRHVAAGVQGLDNKFHIGVFAGHGPLYLPYAGNTLLPFISEIDHPLRFKDMAGQNVVDGVVQVKQLHQGFHSDTVLLFRPHYMYAGVRAGCCAFISPSIFCPGSGTVWPGRCGWCRWSHSRPGPRWSAQPSKSGHRP